jgi:hypothetical protein
MIATNAATTKSNPAMAFSFLLYRSLIRSPAQFFREPARGSVVGTNQPTLRELYPGRALRTRPIRLYRPMQKAEFSHTFKPVSTAIWTGQRYFL